MKRRPVRPVTIRWSISNGVSLSSDHVSDRGYQEVTGFSYVHACSVTWSEVAQSCPTLCNPVDYSLPCSSIHEIFQARILEWVAIPFSRGSSQPWVQSLDWENPPEEGKGCPLQYSGLDNSMDRIVHGVTKSQTQLSDFHLLGTFWPRDWTCVSGVSRTARWILCHWATWEACLNFHMGAGK